MQERIIVTLTTWKKRIGNIPVILDTIYSQTLPPDKVVINLASDEIIPEIVQEYINTHDIEVFRTEAIINRLNNYNPIEINLSQLIKSCPFLSNRRKEKLIRKINSNNKNMS